MSIPKPNKKMKFEKVQPFLCGSSQKIICLKYVKSSCITQEYNIKQHYSINHEVEFSCFERK